MNVALRVIAVLIVILALVIGIVPQFTNCNYGNGMAAMSTPTATAGAMTMMTTASTMMNTASTMMTTAPTMAGGQAMSTKTAAKAATTTKPRCFYSARAEIAVAASLFFIGVFMFVSSRKETWRALSVLGIIQGLFAILLPTVLIGVCMASTMRCREAMEPTLYVAGGLTIAASLAALIVNEMRGRTAGRGTEPAA
jgi:hypothetical protein